MYTLSWPSGSSGILCRGTQKKQQREESMDRGNGPGKAQNASTYESCACVLAGQLARGAWDSRQRAISETHWSTRLPKHCDCTCHISAHLIWYQIAFSFCKKKNQPLLFIC